MGKLKKENPAVLGTDGAPKDELKVQKNLTAILNKLESNSNLPKNITEQYAFCCEAINDVAEQYNIVFNYNYVYLPKDNSWVEIDEYRFRDFLESCAIKIGVNKYQVLRKASITSFKNEFYSYCKKVFETKHKKHLPKLPERKVEEKEVLTPIEITANLLKEAYPNTTFNIVTEKADFGIDEVTFDEVVVELMKKNKNVTSKLLEMVLRSNKEVKHVDPFKSYFESEEILKGWSPNERDYINELSSYVKTTNQKFWQSMFKKHLVRAVGQATNLSDFANRFVIVMQSQEENIGKSSFIRFLNPFSSEYFIEHIDDDINLSITKVFIFNFEEIESLNKIGFNRLKAIISTGKSTIRRLYTQNYVTKPRRCNFFASTNELNFLGGGENSRWLVVNLREIDFSYSKDIDINKVWAQAKFLFDNNFKTDLTPEEWEIAKSQAKEHRFRSKEEEYITENFQPSSKHFATPTDIEHYLNAIGNQSKVNAQRIGATLQAMGYRRVKKHSVYGYNIQTIEGHDIKEHNLSRNETELEYYR